jgi:hypothetical protein
VTARPDPEGNYLRLAIVSDLHAYAIVDKNPKPSHFRVTDAEGEPGENPMAGLSQLISREVMRADLVLCPGDLGHQAQQVAIQYAWSALRKLKGHLGADQLIATAGNHDLDSRYLVNQYDALEFLKHLSPPFPFDDEALNDKFWSRHFVILEGESYRIVVLNSSAYHGVGGKEIEHGRIADITLAKLREALAATTPKPVNVLLCHHHPQQHMEVDLGAYDVMENGQLLLDILGTGKLGRWLVVHGHKHHPKLAYASGGGSSPIVFSAGSLCASLYDKLQTVARNQFHRISIALDKIQTLGLVGIVESWDWASGEGWAPAGATSGLPAVCGFGFRVDPLLMADRIAAAVTGDFAEWSAIRHAMPEVDYLVPQDFSVIRYILHSRHKMEIQDLNDLPHQIGRSA